MRGGGQTEFEPYLVTGPVEPLVTKLRKRTTILESFFIGNAFAMAANPNGAPLRHSENPENQAGILRGFSDYSESHNRETSPMRLRLGGRNDGALLPSPYGRGIEGEGAAACNAVEEKIPPTPLSWICSTLAEARLRSSAPVGSLLSLSGLRPSANPLYKGGKVKSLPCKGGGAKATEGFKAAFTLAEVLITLGIIGIVAAMTLPTLVQNYKTQEKSARIKKFYSTMSQAVKLSELDNGEAYYWTKTPRQANENGTIMRNPSGALEFYNTYLSKYLKKSTELTDDYLIVFMGDGSTMAVNVGHCIDLIYDYNGKKGPDTFGIDRFNFLLCTEEGDKLGYLRDKRIPFDAYFPNACRKNKCSREVLLSECKTYANYCSSLLMNDGWEFKDDYPW